VSLLDDYLLLFLAVVTAMGAVFIRDLFGGVLILAAYSFFLALLWAGLGAVDVAFTEAVVGAGLSTVFFLVALFLTSHQEESRTDLRDRVAALAGLGILGFLLLYGSVDLPVVGDPASPPNAHISPVYLEKSLEDTDTPNVVTAVLADYRGFDTLGETTVIFTAGIACWMLLRRRDDPAS
jgi:multicomponent Na+:H+ antiporter subunit B